MIYVNVDSPIIGFLHSNKKTSSVKENLAFGKQYTSSIWSPIFISIVNIHVGKIFPPILPTFKSRRNWMYDAYEHTRNYDERLRESDAESGSQ